MSGSSSSNSGEEYPYPSHVYVPSFVTVKLSGREMYVEWKTQMMCLLESHDMLSFINGSPSVEKGNEKVCKYNHQLWRRSDALVKGWILGSLSEQTLKNVVKLFPKTDFTAKEAWDKLQIYGPYGPHVLDAAADHDRDRPEESTEDTIKKETKEEENKRSKEANQLYNATLNQRFNVVEKILSRKVVTLRDKITINGNTALHVAVDTRKDKEFLEKMLILATKDNQQPLDMRNSEGSTLLHVAAIVGNTAAAQLLTQMYPDLLYAKDNEGQTPLARALSNIHADTHADTDADTHLCLLEQINVGDMEKGDLLDGGVAELLDIMISSKNYVSARVLFKEISKRPPLLKSLKYDSVLMAIAQNFPPDLNFWEGMMLRVARALVITKFAEATERKERNYSDSRKLLNRICSIIKESKSDHNYYNNAILEASRQNEDEVVKMIVDRVPNAIWSRTEDGHDIIQYAVINRSEKVYNLLYQMSEHRNIYRTIKDPLGNNLLHLAARLAPANKLNSVSGAALQIQLELQWFKEVERFVCPLNVKQENSLGETPQMVFTREHKNLVTEGEKWMKETAQSYSITAALIATIVFAAAVTVPGGNKQDNGIPVFTNETAFTLLAVSDAISLFTSVTSLLMFLLAVSDAISLFTSVTSLLMFLSILTARFSEQDFLVKLPTKLMIGLALLFISTTAMLVAFGVTLFLVFGQNNSWILFPLAALTCLPITSFMTLQFPLVYDLIRATYGRSMFGKKDDYVFY